MNIKEYQALAADSARLKKAAEIIFEQEVRVQDWWKNAALMSVEFRPEFCVVAFAHCGVSNCDDSGELEIPVEKLLAVAEKMDASG